MKIAIIGYGIEGQAVAQHFGKQRCALTVCDQKKGPELVKKMKTWKMRLGPNYLENLAEFDMIFRSPGIPYLKKEFQPVRKKLTSATKYFFEKCPCPIVAVTGTKGKGTTASLIFEMAKAHVKKGRVFLGGNIGQPPLVFLEELTPKDLVVLELSSFQLQDLDRSPHIAVVLSITPDHLDHHQNMEEYIEAKKNIVRFQNAKDFAVLDADNKRTAAFAGATKARVRSYSTQSSVEDGAFLKVGSFLLKKGKTGIFFGRKGETKLIGPHNVENILAAAAAADILGVPVEIITKVVREFPGLPHRLEFITEKGGVQFYNDSASTNPETAIAALRSFDNPTVLIAGGSEKNVDFSPLGSEIALRPNVRAVILMGQTKPKISRAIEAAMASHIRADKHRRKEPLELIAAESYQEAFMVAKVMARPGEIVLLSPACASFDMFANYQERGEIFRNFVMSTHA